MNAPDKVAASPLVSVLVCKTCRADRHDPAQPRPGAVLSAAVAIEAARSANQQRNLSISAVSCLGNCNRGLSAAVAATGSWTYVFGALTVASAADLLAAGELLGNAENGRLPLRGRPESLKGKMIARIPPLPSKQDDIS